MPVLSILDLRLSVVVALVVGLRFKDKRQFCVFVTKRINKKFVFLVGS